ncbi:hypothetical protein XELAEV_18044024mg [Xenopus laevis]|uniref:Uncharacterized protein n=1 Tax=Xenopus laevis TaxID=8355 RepID=A0A974BYA5_XENLA|nr:hypothetical protein XELAEV_18044024mg [Xenopus laevis]
MNFSLQLKKDCQALRYEAVKALILLGYLEASTVDVLTHYLKEAHTALRMDLLCALETSLQKDDLIWESEESKFRLVSSLEQNLACGEQGDEMPLQAATCLSYVDNHNEKASCYLLTYLEHKDMKFRMKVG